MTIRPYELLARFANDGSIAGIHVRHITTVDGRDYEGDPVPLASATDPAFVAFATQFSAGAIAERDALKTQVEELQKQVDALKQYRPFNPRHLASTDVLLARLTQKETKAFYSSEDPLIVGGQQLFAEYEDKSYYVDLDDENVQGLTGYMVQLGMLESMERRAVILRDATEAEAYFPAD